MRFLKNLKEKLSYTIIKNMTKKFQIAINIRKY